MMKSRGMKVAVGVLATLLMALVAAAEGPGMHRGDGFFGGPMRGMFGDFLDLTDAQHAQIKQIYDSAKPTISPLWQQQRQNHQAMMQLITSGNFDQGKAQAIANQSAQVEAQLQVQHALLASQAYQVLTAEQKTKFNDFLAKREQRFQEHMQRHQAAPDAEQTPDR